MARAITKALCIKVSPEDHDALERAAQQTGGTMAAVVRGLIRAYLLPAQKHGLLRQTAPAPEPAQEELGL